MKTSIIIATTILLIACCHMSHDPPGHHIAPAHIKQLMRYHGVQVLYEQHDGQFYFIRDNKKIYIR